jgi:choline-sulfatase
MTTASRLSRLAACIIAVPCMGATQTATAATEKPNVLFIAVDDLNDWVGYLGGHPQAHTPNIDTLAGKGIAFTHAYCSAPVCGPARTSLMYGRYPHKSGA